jgi:DUF4097 and DUF4098 domain-containing protein YvlB
MNSYYTAALALVVSFVIGNPWDVRDQINKTVTLSPGANVLIKGINGPVVIETTEGESAQINIDITASDQETLAARPLVVENTATSLTIRTLDQERGGRDHAWVRHNVRLRLPRTVNLAVSGVNGQVTAQEITGTLSLKGVNGAVKVDGAGTATEISGVNGRVTVGLTKLSASGLKVSGINGGVDLAFAGQIDAQIDVRGVNGGVNSEFPMTVVGEMKRGELRGTIGAGGPRIDVSGINGGVQLKRQ